MMYAVLLLLLLLLSFLLFLRARRCAPGCAPNFAMASGAQTRR